MRTIARLRNVSIAGLAVSGGLAILPMMLHVATDVALRNLVNRPVPATYEIVTH